MLMPTDITKRVMKLCKNNSHEIIALRSFSMDEYYNLVFIFKDECSDEDIVNFYKTLEVDGKIHNVVEYSHGIALDKFVTTIVEKVKKIYNER